MTIVRMLDYWVGIPACFILSLLHYVLKFFPKRACSYKKVVFIQLSEMGTAILAYPAVKYLKKKYPGAELFYMIFEKNRASVDMLGEIPPGNILTINDKSLPLFFADVVKSIIRMHKEKIDVVFDLELFSRASAIFSFFSGAPIKVGFYRYRMEGLYRGSFFTHKIQYNFQQHLSKTLLSFAKVIHTKRKDYPTMDEQILDDEIVTKSYKSSPEGIESIWKKLREANPGVGPENRLIILNPSAGLLPIRAWPIDNYIRLAQRLLEDPNNHIILTGGTKDASITRKLFSSLNCDRCIDLTCKTTFPELVDLYNVADVLVTNDSGPAHFASLTSIKNFVFFGPETPVLYRPLGKHTRILYSDFPCSPCITAFNHRYTACLRSKCLEVISVDEVYSLVKKELAQPNEVFSK